MVNWLGSGLMEVILIDKTGGIQLREISFRANCKETGNWLYGGFCNVPPPPQCFGEPEPCQPVIVCEKPNTFADWNMPRQMCMIDVDGNTVGQHTGMYDMNNIPIYEGDIIKTQSFTDRPYSTKAKEFRHVGVVEYDIAHGDGFGGELKGRDIYWGAKFKVNILDKKMLSKYSCSSWGDFFRCEVIGNIHDNPEMIEVKDE